MEMEVEGPRNTSIAGWRERRKRVPTKVRQDKTKK